MTNRQVQFRRDTATNLSAATPAAGEPGWDTTNKKLVIGDGSTAGGIPFAKESQPDLILKQSSTPTPTAEGQIQWDTDDNRIAIGDGAATRLFSDDSVLASLFGQVVGMINGTIVASVNANALTVAIKTLAGADPSATDPVYIFFRNGTAATGDYVKRTLTAATSIVISSGSTMGASANTAFRLRLIAFDDAGTLRLGLVNTVSGVNIMPLRDDMLVQSTAEGGAGTADSAQVIYTGTAVTSNRAIRMLGYLDWGSGLATPGTWSAGPTKTQLQGPGVPMPGQAVQSVKSETGAVATGAITIPFDDTIPQSTEGTQFMSQAITPSAAPNILRIEAQLELNNSFAGAHNLICALFQDSTANALVAAYAVVANQGYTAELKLEKSILAAATASTTLKVRGGSNQSGTVNFNGDGSGNRVWGGASNSYLKVEEIAA